MFKICFVFWTILTGMMIIFPFQMKRQYPDYGFNDFFEDYFAPWFLTFVVMAVLSLFA